MLHGAVVSSYEDTNKVDVQPDNHFEQQTKKYEKLRSYCLINDNDDSTTLVCD